MVERAKRIVKGEDPVLPRGPGNRLAT